MLVFVIRRILISIPVLIVSTMLTFILVKLSGNPLLYLEQRQPKPAQAVINAASHKLWLDRSWPSQYWHWISNLVFHGNWGPAVQSSSDNIRSSVFSAFLVTSKLVIAAVVISLVLAIVTGVVSAVKQYSLTDYTTTTVGFLFLSMPTFWFALLLKQGAIKFNDSTGTHFFGTIGDESIPPKTGTWNVFVDILGHTVMPVVVLGLVGYAAWSRFTRASMLEVLNSDYVRLARAKGLKSRTVLVRHALRTALIPLTTVTALDIAALLGGAIVTETVFQWHGMGYLFVTALNQRDFNVMLGWLLVSAVIVILFNLFADLLYGVLDPRIRHA